MANPPRAGAILWPILAATLVIGTRAGAGTGLAVTSEVVVADADFPLHVTQAPGDPTRLFYIERFGSIRVVKDGVLLATPFLDHANLGALRCIAFHPDYQSNAQLFVIHSNADDDSVISRFTAASPDLVDAASQEILLTVERPTPSHGVNWLGFGPDGYLYISSGDGGAATHGAMAQNLTTLLGKILRIDVDGGTPYAIPPDNPFVGQKAARQEIWSYGLRNAWRCSFDMQSGDFWIADVGDASREEFSYQPAGSPGGENYGWNCMEGNICHTPADGCTCEDPSLTDPLYVYNHQTGCAIIGGFVYRGSAIPNLQGLYVFGDNCFGKVYAYDSVSGDVTEITSISPSLNSFGQGLDGELFACSSVDVRKLVFTDCNGNQIPDVTDIGNGTSVDCNANDIPDECEPDCNGNGVADECDIADGTSFDNNGNGVPDECDAASDLDGNGVVNTADLLLLLGAWGDCPGGEACPADLNNDGFVGTADLLILISNWD